MAETESYYVEDWPVDQGGQRVGPASPGSGDNFLIQQLEQRINSLEGELRLIHRKLRSYDLSRHDLVKGVVIEVLNSSPMSIIFSPSSSVTRGFPEAASRPTPMSENRIVADRSRRGHDDESYEESGDDDRTARAGDAVIPKLERKRKHSEPTATASSTEHNGDDEEPLTHVAVVHDMPSFEEASGSDDEYENKFNHSSSTKAKKNKNSRKSMDAGKKKSKSLSEKSSEKIQRHITRSRSTYVPVRQFDSRSECEAFVKSDINCRYRTRKPIPGGFRAFYNCKQEQTCPFRMNVFYPDESNQPTELFQTPETHNHDHSTIPFGISEQERHQIRSLADAGRTSSDIIQALVERGYKKLNKNIFENFYSTLQNRISATPATDELEGSD